MPIFGGAGNDQRGARLVDENRVDFVDDGEVEWLLHAVFESEGHVVAQVIEAEFVVRAISDGTAVGGLLFRHRRAGLDHAHAESEKFVDRPHPVGVALGEIFVNRDDMHALARKRVQIGRQGRHQGLAFAGAHLGDRTFVQHDAADHLHIEMTQLQSSLARLAHGGEGLRQQFLKRFAPFQPGAQFPGSRANLLVGLAFVLRFQPVDRSHGFPHPLQLPRIAAAKDSAE